MADTEIDGGNSRVIARSSVWSQPYTTAIWTGNYQNAETTKSIIARCVSITIAFFIPLFMQYEAEGRLLLYVVSALYEGSKQCVLFGSIG